jgi:hypothetical protein
MGYRQRERRRRRRAAHDGRSTRGTGVGGVVGQVVADDGEESDLLRSLRRDAARGPADGLPRQAERSALLSCAERAALKWRPSVQWEKARRRGRLG